jgi:hypothetical protein
VSQGGRYGRGAHDPGSRVAAAQGYRGSGAPGPSGGEPRRAGQAVLAAMAAGALAAQAKTAEVDERLLWCCEIRAASNDAPMRGLAASTPQLSDEYRLE